MTARTRITFLVAAAGFVASLLFSVILFFELVEQPFDILDEVLKEEAQRTLQTVTARQQGPSASADSGANAQLYAHWLKIYEQGSNRLMFASPMARFISLPEVKPGSGMVASAEIPPGRPNRGQDGSWEMTFRVRSFLLASGDGAYIVQIARPMKELETEIRDLILGLISGLLLSLLFLAAVSRFVAGRILKPIGKMKDLAKDINEKNLAQRIPTGKERDEFSELARTINRMLDRLQYSFERQRDFLFDTSHELKTPLTTIRLAIDNICGADDETPSSVEKENLFLLKNQVWRMERLVKDLLNLSSLEALPAISPEMVSLDHMLSALAADYQFLADARGIEMDLQLPDRLMVRGDGEKLKRAFSNILDNAIKYNVDGGRITVTGVQSAEEATITISNTGPGIAGDELDKVFEQFYRVEKSRSTQHGGSGLGLAIVKKIIDLHGGRVELRSQPGEWAQLTLHLPKHPEKPLA